MREKQRSEIKNTCEGAATAIAKAWRAALPFFGCAGVWAFSAYALPALYRLMYNSCMNGWGVTADNVYRAPAAIRAWMAWSGVILVSLQGGFTALASLALSHRRFGAGYARGVAFGAAAMTAIWLALLATRLMKLGGSLTSPAFSANTLAYVYTLFIGAAGEACLFAGCLYPLLLRRVGKPAALAIYLVCFAVADFEPSGLYCANQLLLAGVCIALCDKFAGPAPAAGFLGAFRYFERAVYGLPGYSSGLYETYPVRLYRLSGGNAGVMYGPIASAALLAALLLLVFFAWKRPGSNRAPK